VWVLAGPVFGVRPTRLPAGPAVPEAFFMVLVDESDGRVRTQAFLFPQETQAGVPLERFVTTIDEIERRTGLDFLGELEDVAEESLESKRAQSVW
jgi:endonuclease G